MHSLKIGDESFSKAKDGLKQRIEGMRSLKRRISEGNETKEGRENGALEGKRKGVCELTVCRCRSAGFREDRVDECCSAHCGAGRGPRAKGQNGTAYRKTKEPSK